MTTSLAAATALQFLLTAHPEVDETPFEWTIEAEDRVIRPFITVDHPRGEESVRLLAAALELPVTVSRFGSVEEPKAAISTEGRWGGAGWRCVAYVKAAPVTEDGFTSAPVPVSEAVVRP